MTHDTIGLIHIGISGLLLGMLLGINLPRTDAVHLWIFVGIVINFAVVVIMAIRRTRRSA